MAKMTAPVTAASIRSIIEGNMEDTDRADRILAAIRQHDGKLLSEPIARKIGEATGEKNVRIRRQYGMTHLEFGGYGYEQDPDRGVSLLLAHAEKGVYIDADDIEKRNLAYYSAAKERNEKRRAALADGATLEKLAGAISALNASWAVFEELTEYGTPLSPDSCSLDRLIDKGLRNRRD